MLALLTPTLLPRGLRTFGLSMALCAAHSSAHSQATVEAAGLVAGLAVSRVDASFNGGTSADLGAVGIHLGVRVIPGALLCHQRSVGFCDTLKRLSLTPHLAYAATHVLGLNPATDPYSFSFLDLPRWRISYLVSKALRLSLITGGGRHTAERFTQGDIANYWTMSGRTFGAAVEVPVVKSGRGFELAVLRLSGTFDSLETRTSDKTAKLITGSDLGYRSLVVQFGWSGPFTGISLPWR